MKTIILYQKLKQFSFQLNKNFKLKKNIFKKKKTKKKLKYFHIKKKNNV